MVCDGVVIINRGRIVAQGTQTELVEQVFPTARIEVEVGGPPTRCGGAARACPACSGWATSPRRRGRHRALPRRVARGTATCAARWCRLVPARGWRLLELHQAGLSLEDVFIRVVAGEEAAETATIERPPRGRLMRWLPVFKKEMRLYFGSPVAYVVATFFLIISGWSSSPDLPHLQRCSRCRPSMNPMAGAEPQSPTEDVMRAALLQHERGAAVLHPDAHHAALRRGEEVGDDRAAADLSGAGRRGPARQVPRRRAPVRAAARP